MWILGPALSYTLHLAADCQSAFGIQRYGGGVSLTAPLDYEERSWYTLTVRASDSRHQSEANITVLVEDVNDNAPMFTQDLYQVCRPTLSSTLMGLQDTRKTVAVVRRFMSL